MAIQTGELTTATVFILFAFALVKNYN